jgi:hypothetical protein
MIFYAASFLRSVTLKTAQKAGTESVIPYIIPAAILLVVGLVITGVTLSSSALRRLYASRYIFIRRHNF